MMIPIIPMSPLKTNPKSKAISANPTLKNIKPKMIRNIIHDRNPPIFNSINKQFKYQINAKKYLENYKLLPITERPINTLIPIIG